jgi:hypothetical protein
MNLAVFKQIPVGITAPLLKNLNERVKWWNVVGNKTVRISKAAILLLQS